MSEYSKPRITGDGVLSIDSSDKVKSNASRRQIKALKGVKVVSIHKAKEDGRSLVSRILDIQMEQLDGRVDTP